MIPVREDSEVVIIYPDMLIPHLLVPFDSLGSQAIYDPAWPSDMMVLAKRISTCRSFKAQLKSSKKVLEVVSTWDKRGGFFLWIQELGCSTEIGDDEKNPHTRSGKHM